MTSILNIVVYYLPTYYVYNVQCLRPTCVLGTAVRIWICCVGCVAILWNGNSWWLFNVTRALSQIRRV